MNQDYLSVSSLLQTGAFVRWLTYHLKYNSNCIIETPFIVLQYYKLSLQINFIFKTAELFAIADKIKKINNSSFAANNINITHRLAGGGGLSSVSRLRLFLPTLGQDLSFCPDAGLLLDFFAFVIVVEDVGDLVFFVRFDVELECRSPVWSESVPSQSSW